jgi:TDG/mug DNA glycosylase family protein
LCSRDRRLKRCLRPHAPRILCFNGKRAAREALRQKKVQFGLQPTTFGRTLLFVAPSTSAAARRWWDLKVWEELAELVRGLRGR